jgi:hypothetical protein
MTSASGAGSLKQTNWAARFFWFTSMTFAIIGGGMEAYVYFAFTDRNLWNWVGIAEALARAIGTQLVIMTLTLAGVKLWQSGAHPFWKTVLFIFFQVIAFGAATHGFVLVWVAAVAFRRDDLLGTADQGNIEIPFLGTFPLATLVLVLIALLPYYEGILSLIGPIVTKERRALSPEEIEEMDRREQAMARLNATRQKNLASSMVGLRNAGAALITGKIDEPLLATNTPADSEGNDAYLSSEMGAQNVLTFPGKSADSRQTGRGASGGRGLRNTHVKAEGVLAYIHKDLRRLDVTIDDVKAWMSQQPKASRANEDNPDGITLVGAPYVMRKSTAFAAAKKMWLPQERDLALAD